MEEKLKKIRKQINDLITQMDNACIYGPIPYLETMLEELEAAEGELEEYNLEN